ncbi:MAG: polysaccharide deacetylase family protein [Terracidiphilus sp.]|jgi:peptidoglycan/xylan/chitin deacetylase (PgdA/CDA1 family)
MLSPSATGISIGLGAAATLGLATGGFAYAALWPTSQLFGQALTAPPNPGELALTFDDGPHPTWTPRLLEVLARRDVRVTFFLVGSHAQTEPALVRQIAAAGHLIGNHSWSHRNLALAPARTIEQELSRTSQELDQIAQIAGAPVHYFRPPFGARRPEVLRAARRLGMVPVLWNAMTTDWKTPSADAIASRLRHKIDSLEHQGQAANIVLHDGSHSDPAANRAPSIAAAAQLIARYQPTHQFVTLDGWA